MSEMHDPYEDQLAAARYRAERDQARQECERLRARLRDSVPRDAYERRRAAWLRHIRECEGALGKRNRRIKELEDAALERRTVREEDRDAAEWVREQGGLDVVETRWNNDTKLVDAVLCALWPCGIPDVGGNEHVMDELSKRLMPEDMEWLVEAWPRFEDGGPVRFLDDFERYGDENGVSVVTMYSDGSFALNFRAYSKGERVKRPEPTDSWERIEEDAYKDDCEYFGRDLNGCNGCPASRQDIDNFYCNENEKACDLVRRCRALAERDR